MTLLHASFSTFNSGEGRNLKAVWFTWSLMAKSAPWNPEWLSVMLVAESGGVRIADTGLLMSLLRPATLPYCIVTTLVNEVCLPSLVSNVVSVLSGSLSLYSMCIYTLPRQCCWPAIVILLTTVVATCYSGYYSSGSGVQIRPPHIPDFSALLYSCRRRFLQPIIMGERTC